jgi:hypothetical protein
MDSSRKKKKKSYENSTSSLAMNKVSQLTAIISESVQGRVSPPPKRLPILSRKDAAMAAPPTDPQLEHHHESKRKKKKKDSEKSTLRKQKKKMKSANEREVEQFLKSKAVRDRYQEGLNPLKKLKTGPNPPL